MRWIWIKVSKRLTSNSPADARFPVISVTLYQNTLHCSPGPFLLPRLGVLPEKRNSSSLRLPPELPEPPSTPTAIEALSPKKMSLSTSPFFLFFAFFPQPSPTLCSSVPSGRHHRLTRSHPMAAQGSLFPRWSANSNNRKKPAIPLWGVYNMFTIK